MKFARQAMTHAIIISFTLLACPSLQAQNRLEKVLVGDTKVKVLQTYEGGRPFPKPSEVLLYWFDVPLDAITLDDSPLAHLLSHDPIAHLKHDERRDESPDGVAVRVQTAFSQTLIHELKKTSIPAISVSREGPEPRGNLLTVSGNFTTIHLGNKTKRMLLGFGRGASDVKAHVFVSLSVEGGPIVLNEFEVTSESGKKPGAAATMGVGSAAASVAISGATDGKATVESDAARMAKVVAQQIESVMTARQWLVPAAQHH